MKYAGKLFIPLLWMVLFASYGNDSGLGAQESPGGDFASNGEGKFPGTVANPGSPINTGDDELYPSITADGKVLVFNSRKNGAKFHDIYISTKKDDGTWSRPEKFHEINSPYNDETPFISPEGDLILFSSDRDGSTESSPDEFGRILVSYDLYYSIKTGKKWSSPRPVAGNINTAQHERFPSLSADRKTLYFTTWPFARIEQTKVIQAKLSAGRFLRHSTLEIVQDGHNEVQFTYDPVREGFFFSARKKDGLGGWDFYFLSQGSKTTESPMHPREPLNSTGNELGIGASRTAFVFSSDRPGGEGGYDIYFADRKSEEDQISIRVIDSKTKQPLEAKTKIIAVQIQKTHSRTTSHELERTTDSDGRVAFRAHDVVQQIRIVANRDGYLPYAENFTVEELKKNEHEIPLTRLSSGAKFDVRAINFEPNSATLREESFPFLDSMVSFLKEKSGIRLEIIGHTDLHGSEYYNRTLSLQRAKAVRDYLVDRGIDMGRLQVTGKGKSEPILDRIDDEADQRNRRTEFRLIE